jgi:hypothetical protein
MSDCMELFNDIRVAEEEMLDLDLDLDLDKYGKNTQNSILLSKVSSLKNLT